MLHPDVQGDGEEDHGPSPLDIRRDEKAFRAQVRAEVHSLVKALSEGDWEEAEALVRPDEEDPWDAKRFKTEMAPFLEEYGQLTFDHHARLPTRTHLQKTGDGTWTRSQTLVDPEGNDDWSVQAEINLGSYSPGQLLLKMVRIGL